MKFIVTVLGQKIWTDVDAFCIGYILYIVFYCFILNFEELLYYQNLKF